MGTINKFQITMVITTITRLKINEDLLGWSPPMTTKMMNELRLQIMLHSPFLLQTISTVRLVRYLTSKTNKASLWNSVWEWSGIGSNLLMTFILNSTDEHEGRVLAHYGWCPRIGYCDHFCLDYLLHWLDLQDVCWSGSERGPRWINPLLCLALM